MLVLFGVLGLLQSLLLPGLLVIRLCKLRGENGSRHQKDPGCEERECKFHDAEDDH